MSSIVVALVLVSSIIIISLILVQVEKKQKRIGLNQFLARFGEFGTLNKLTFSSQEIMQYAAIRLDGIQRKLLVLTGNNESSAFNQLIDLRDVKTCTVKKQFQSVNVGKGQSKLGQHLETISLCFESKWGKPQIEVLFYHYITGNVSQIREKEKKARHWEAILSKMLKGPLKEAA